MIFQKKKEKKRNKEQETNKEGEEKEGSNIKSVSKHVVFHVCRATSLYLFAAQCVAVSL